MLAQYYHQPCNNKWLGVPFSLWLYEAGRRRFNKEAIQQRMVQLKKDFSQRIAAAAGNKRKVQRLQKKCVKKLNTQQQLLKRGNFLMRWGEPPVIYTPQQRALTEQNFLNYLHAKGYFDAQVSSEVKLHNKKATITYHVEEKLPYLIGELRWSIPDKAIEKLLQTHQHQSLLKKGDCYDQDMLHQERERIYDLPQ